MIVLTHLLKKYFICKQSAKKEADANQENSSKRTQDRKRSENSNVREFRHDAGNILFWRATGRKLSGLWKNWLAEWTKKKAMEGKAKWASAFNSERVDRGLMWTCTNDTFHTFEYITKRAEKFSSFATKKRKALCVSFLVIDELTARLNQEKLMQAFVSHLHTLILTHNAQSNNLCNFFRHFSTTKILSRHLSISILRKFMSGLQ